MSPILRKTASSSPSSPSHPSGVSFSLPLLHTAQSLGGANSAPYGGPACHTWGNVGGGSFLPPVSLRCRGHASAQSAPASPSSSPVSLSTPPRGISAVPPFPERTSGIPGRPCPLSGLSIGIFAPPIPHVKSSDDSTLIRLPSVHRTPRTPSNPAVVLCTIYLPP